MGAREAHMGAVAAGGSVRVQSVQSATSLDGLAMLGPQTVAVLETTCLLILQMAIIFCCLRSNRRPASLCALDGAHIVLAIGELGLETPNLKPTGFKSKRSELSSCA